MTDQTNTPAIDTEARKEAGQDVHFAALIGKGAKRGVCGGTGTLINIGWLVTCPECRAWMDGQMAAGKTYAQIGAR